MATPNLLKYDSCLGYGSFGIVLRAVDILTPPQPPIAVKFLFPADTGEKEREQILRECNISLEFQKHPNVVQVFKVIETKLSAKEIEEIFSDEIMAHEDQRSLRDRCILKARRVNGLEIICLQMELCAENLRRWLNEKHDICEVNVQITQVTVALNLIAGLEFLHDKKIIHRDLKPENIMFSKQGFTLPVKIGDFGLARKVHSEESQTGSMTTGVGTRSYMAPEILTRQQYSLQADLYSLGLIIWEVVQFVKCNLFERLVYDEETALVQEHPVMDGVKGAIINLTRRRVEARIKTLDELEQIKDKWEDARTSLVWEWTLNEYCTENIHDQDNHVEVNGNHVYDIEPGSKHGIGIQLMTCANIQPIENDPILKVKDLDLKNSTQDGNQDEGNSSDDDFGCYDTLFMPRGSEKRWKQGRLGKPVLAKADISAPTEFRHIHHVSLSPETFGVENWLTGFLDKTGIDSNAVQDEKTRSSVEEHCGVQTGGGYIYGADAIAKPSISEQMVLRPEMDDDHPFQNLFRDESLPITLPRIKINSNVRRDEKTNHFPELKPNNSPPPSPYRPPLPPKPFYRLTENKVVVAENSFLRLGENVSNAAISRMEDD